MDDITINKLSFNHSGFNRILNSLPKLPKINLSFEEYEKLKQEILIEYRNNNNRIDLISFITFFINKYRKMNLKEQSLFLSKHSVVITAPDLEELLLRPIIPSDKEIMVNSVMFASPLSLFLRFMHPIKRLSPDQLEYLSNIDYINHFAFGIIQNKMPRSRGVAVARYIRDSEEPDLAEWAVIVCDDYQNKSIGSALLYALSVVAVKHGIKRFGAVVHPTNLKILNGLKKLNAIKAVRYGSTYHIFDLPVYPEFVKNPKIRELVEIAANGGSTLNITDYLEVELQKVVKYTTDIICNGIFF
uniref:N-acetyltransferase domain-containing protein n=1 Tax=Opalinidae sp. TaxID=2059444 RepID=A0A649UZ62_9STRA|nr:hypothetical protein [Opalinidae sp.]